MTLYNPSNLPKNDNLNRFAFVIDVHDEMFIRKGKMIAYYGQMKFESVGSGVLDILVKEAFNAPLHVHNFVVVTGNGQLLLGDNGNDVACYDIDDANLTVRANNLLGFSKNVTCRESIMPGFLTLLGTGKVIAASNGPVHFLEPPCRVDPQAILGWADCPCPAVRYDYNHVTNTLNAVGAYMGITLSGEEQQIEFTGKGNVLIQSSEMALHGNPTLAQMLLQIPSLGTAELGSLNSAISREIAAQQRSNR